MRSCRGELLAQQISKFSPMSGTEALSVQRRVFADGPATRAEAEALFRECASFDRTDTAWRQVFVEAVCDHLLGQNAEYGVLEFDGEDWLIDTISNGGLSHDSANFELLQAVLERAKNASMRLGRVGLFSALKCGQQYAALDGDVRPAQQATA
ncbi:MAG: hypothetical protein JKX99_00985 [Robiginitomaculum sp.]|nr:hypothetical protein [Robiginitomaculum sp.]